MKKGTTYTLTMSMFDGLSCTTLNPPVDQYPLMPYAKKSDSKSETDHFINISPEVPLVSAEPPTSGGDVL